MLGKSCRRNVSPYDLHRAMSVAAVNADIAPAQYFETDDHQRPPGDGQLGCLSVVHKFVIRRSPNAASTVNPGSTRRREALWDWPVWPWTETI